MNKSYTEDVMKYKKKSKKKGLTRSKHKHENIMVCLETHERHQFSNENDSMICKSSIVHYLASVCSICGRIDNIYLTQPDSISIPCDMTYYEYLNNLPVWYSENFWDKIAITK